MQRMCRMKVADSDANVVVSDQDMDGLKRWDSITPS
jgi:hypothetical protein